MLKQRRKKIITIALIAVGVIVIALIVIFFISRYTSQEECLTCRGEILTDTGEIITKKEVEEQRQTFNNKNPFIKFLPYHNNHFLIEYDHLLPDGQAIYKITLSVYIDNPNDAQQLEKYKKQYSQYKNEAIKWIQSTGTDYNGLKIVWTPEDPKNIKINNNQEDRD